jgi:predicted RNA-binding protein YlqC (UPF0109 family)
MNNRSGSTYKSPITSVEGDSVKELIEYIALSLVDDPSQVFVSQYRSGGRENLELHVAREDMGRVIGKGGRVANSMRVLLRVAAAREGKQASLDVAEPK